MLGRKCYLGCEKCDATFGQDLEYSRGYHAELYELAKLAGWEVIESKQLTDGSNDRFGAIMYSPSEHYCPYHSSKNKLKNN